jgi:hypothetical protein
MALAMAHGDDIQCFELFASRLETPDFNREQNSVDIMKHIIEKSPSHIDPNASDAAGQFILGFCHPDSPSDMHTSLLITSMIWILINLIILDVM